MRDRGRKEDDEDARLTERKTISQKKFFDFFFTLGRSVGQLVDKSVGQSVSRVVGRSLNEK